MLVLSLSHTPHHTHAPHTTHTHPAHHTPHTRNMKCLDVTERISNDLIFGLFYAER
jgi:hypothetical protein